MRFSCNACSLITDVLPYLDKEKNGCRGIFLVGQDRNVEFITNQGRCTLSSMFSFTVFVVSIPFMCKAFFTNLTSCVHDSLSFFSIMLQFGIVWILFFISLHVNRCSVVSFSVLHRLHLVSMLFLFL